MATLLPIAICMLACPVLMFILMKGMGNKNSAGEARPDLAAKPVRDCRTRDGRLEELKAELTSVQATREGLAQELGRVEADAPPAARKGEAAGRVSDNR